MVPARDGYFDFDLTDANDGALVRLFGYTQRITLRSGQGDEPRGWLEVGGSLIYVPRD